MRETFLSGGAGVPVECGSAPANGPNYFFDYFSSNLCFASPFVFCIILGNVADVRSFYVKLFNMVRYTHSAPTRKNVVSAKPFV